MIELQKASSKEDIEELHHLAEEIWLPYWTQRLGKEHAQHMFDKFQSYDSIKEQLFEGYTYKIAKYDGKSAGYFAVVGKEDHLHLSKIYVNEKFRGKGLGRVMFEDIKNIAQALGYKKICLYVNKRNFDSIEIYKKWGFKVIEPVVIDVGEGFVMDDYLMEIELSEKNSPKQTDLPVLVLTIVIFIIILASALLSQQAHAPSVPSGYRAMDQQARMSVSGYKANTAPNAFIQEQPPEQTIQQDVETNADETDTFTLLTSEGVTLYTPKGAIGGEPQSVFPPDAYSKTPRGSLLTIGDNALIVDDGISKVQTMYKIPPDFPVFGRVKDVVYVPSERLTILTTSSREGYLYRFDFKNKKWLDAKEQKSGGFQSLAYDPYTKNILCTGVYDESDTIYQITPQGDIVKKYDLKDKLSGYDKLYDKGAGPAPLSIAPLKDEIILLGFEGRRFESPKQGYSGILRHIWTLNRATGEVKLTYKKF